MVRAIAAILIGGCSFLLLLITAPKLYEMLQIEGWIPGGRVQQVTITAKAHRSAEESQDGREVFWIAWNGGDISKRGAHRTSVFEEKWVALKVGDPLEIVSIPGSSGTYLRHGDIYVSPGNFVFDIVLLLLEVFGISFALQVLVDNLRAWRGRDA